MILDVITEEIQEDTQWAMLFADDLVICDETRERTGYRSENWSGSSEDAGLKVRRSKSIQKINMKEYDSNGKTTAGISIQIFGNYDRPRGRMLYRSGKGG